jgi:hypothetical protein
MRWSVLIGSLCLASSFAAAEEAYSLKAVDRLPDGYHEKVAAAVEPNGYEITGKDGPVCTVWLAKSLALKSKFKPSLSTKYPLTAGHFVGLLQVHSATFSDFRERDVKPGLYTLRYGQQPQDGNHVGTSELADFLLAVPADSDADPAPVKVPALMKRSAKATGSNHPAIYSLLPPAEESSEPKLAHEAAKDLWILETTAAEQKVPLRLVVIGKSEG